MTKTSTPEHVTTPDGWRLNLRRFTPRHPSGSPVLCVHGHAMNGWTFFGGPEGGLVSDLVASGREVFTVDLRGAPGSLGPTRGAVVSIADKARFDVPAAIEHVARRAGSGSVDVVAHSLGGVITYLIGLADASTSRRIGRVVTIGSPLRVPRAALPRALQGNAVARVMGRLGRLPVCGIVSTLGRHAPRSAFPAHFTADSIDGQTFSTFMRHGVTDLYGSELAELARWLQVGDARALDPRLHPSREASRLPFPTRFIVGSDDGLTTADCVAEAHMLLGGDESDLHVLDGFRHADILLGKRARAEVFPRVSGWLEGRSGATGSGQTARELARAG